jgi:hypothetical protein
MHQMCCCAISPSGMEARIDCKSKEDREKTITWVESVSITEKAHHSPSLPHSSLLPRHNPVMALCAVAASTTTAFALSRLLAYTARPRGPPQVLAHAFLTVQRAVHVRRRTTPTTAGVVPPDASRGRERILRRCHRRGRAGLDDGDERPGSARVWRGLCPRGGIGRQGRMRVRRREEGR